MPPDYGRFRNPMDVESLRQRLVFDRSNPIYALAAQAAGHESAFTVDKLSWKLKAVLPALIAALAAEVERENAQASQPTMAQQLAQARGLVGSLMASLGPSADGLVRATAVQNAKDWLAETDEIAR